MLLAAFFLLTQDPTSFLDATLWVQTSVEYRAVALQTYRAAGQNLLRALRDPSWTAALEQDASAAADLPPAVVLDLDETVLDNSPYQARLILDKKQYTEATWAEWVREIRAGTVPGALEFLKTAAALGIQPVFITNRTCDSSSLEDPTVQVLRRNQIPFQLANLLCRDTTSDKTGRRRAVAARYRILLLLGDDIRDFTTAQPPLHYFGERWFVLPNPMYGSWHTTIDRLRR